MQTIACARQGCNSTFASDNNPEGSCSYHPGAPFFHEGLKSWSCCKDINKPVMEFDQFTKIKGCTKSSHLAKSALPPKPTPSSTDTSSTPASSAPTTISSTGTETYGSALPPKPKTDENVAPTAVAAPAPVAPKEVVEEQDEPGVEVPEGSKCKRRGCGVAVGEKDECVYHPGVAIFREGSKGYTCCKRRVLEFDEFLRIEGCKTTQHLFVGAKKVAAGPDETVERELVSSRIDFYQTPSQVHVSIFAKQCDKDLSKVVLQENEINLDLFLPQNKRTLRTLSLFGPIEPSRSSFSILGTKVAITLQKANGVSWSLLEIPEGGKSSLPQGYGTVFAPSRV